jgi:hypothetical protein
MFIQLLPTRFVLYTDFLKPIAVVLNWFSNAMWELLPADFKSRVGATVSFSISSWEAYPGFQETLGKPFEAPMWL